MTELDIINRALARLGAQAASALDSTERNARIAVAEYDFSRDEVLRSHPWPCLLVHEYGEEIADLGWEASQGYSVDDFIVVGTSLYICITTGTSGSTEFTESTSTDITDGTVHWKYLCSTTNNTGYSYQYVIPADCMRILMVGHNEKYLRAGRFIFTNVEDAVIQYVKKSEDPDEWDNYIQYVIALRLASSIAQDITGGKVDSSLLENEYMIMLKQAQSIASGEASQETDNNFTWSDSEYEFNKNVNH